MVILLTVVTLLVVSATTLPAATVELAQAVHFIAPSGDDVVLEASTYTVEPAEQWIRLIPEGGSRTDAILLAADVTSPNQSLPEVTPSSIQARSFSTGEDEHYLVLLLPNGQSWVAKGSYSGVRTRGTTAQDVVLKYGVNFLKSDNSNIYENYFVEEMSLGFCLMRCELRSQCQGFTWKPGKKQCYILTSLNSAQGVSDPSSISGYSRSQFVEQWKMIVPDNNLARTGTALGKAIQTSLQDCHVRCASNTQCKAFNWRKPPERTMCSLKKDSTKTLPDNSSISGVKEFIGDASRAERQEREEYWTKVDLPKCINAALAGQDEKFLNLWGQKWHCKKATITYSTNSATITGQLSHHRNNVIDDQAY